MNPRIDAHQHFWRKARGDYGWLRPELPGLAPLCRDFLPADLRGTLLAHGVTQTVLVQAADSEAETDFMLSLAREHDFIGGVVGWVDLARAESVETLQRWARSPKFKGVRPMLQDLPEADWIARAPHPAVMQALLQLGLRFDALVKAPQLAALDHFLRAWPALPVVIDHAAKPQLTLGWPGEQGGPPAAWAVTWQHDIARLAAHPQVLCKLSGLFTEMSPVQRSTPEVALETLRPLWHTLLERFGPARLLWGSDWPVLTLAGDYAGWVEVSDMLLAELSASDQALVRHGNAERFYGLSR